MNRDRVMRCPFPECGQLLLYKKQDFWCCPDCGIEVWPPEESKLKEFEAQARSKQYEAQIQESLKGRVDHDYFFLAHNPTMPVSGNLVPQIDPSKRGGGRKSGRRTGSKKKNNTPLHSGRFKVN